MANDLNLFVLWANGRHKETEIINDINRHFEILQSFEITWTPKLFTRNLSRFYGKKLPSAVKKKRLCGTGSFLVICVNDTQPRIHNGKNLNIIAAKARYRQIIGSNCIHAGDLQPEAEENLLFLTGLNWQDLLSSRQQPIRRPIKLYQDLCGTPSWLDEEQFEQFLRKLPNIRFSRNADEFKILTDDRHQTCRLLNASKKSSHGIATATLFPFAVRILNSASAKARKRSNYLSVSSSSSSLSEADMIFQILRRYIQTLIIPKTTDNEPNK